MRTWRSASELKLNLPAAPETRRISEWPSGYFPGTFLLSHIDPFSITIVKPDFAIPDEAGGPGRERVNEGPTFRFNVLACGLGAPVVAEMLRVGSYLANPRCQGLEDVVVLTEIHPELNLPWNSSFPAGLDPENLARTLLDPQTVIHAIVSYDINTEAAAAELKQFRDIRDVYRPECSIVVLRRFPGVDVALGEFRTIRVRKSGMSRAAYDLYVEVVNAIMNQKDSDPDGYL